MMIPGPVLLLAGPLLPALVLLFLRRWPVVSGVVGGLVALGLRLWVAALPVTAAAGDAALFGGPVLTILGRSLVLTPVVQQLMLQIYVAAALLFFLSALWPQGADFVPAGLGLLASLAAALMFRPVIFGLLFWLLAAIFGAVLIQSGRVGSTRAALRYLLLTTVAVAILLLAAWMLGSQPEVFVSAIWRLLLLGLLILLAGFPFHIWVRPAVAEAAPLAAAFVFGLGQLVLVMLAFELLLAVPLGQQTLVFQETQFLPLLRLFGALTLAVGGLLALTAQAWSGLLGYALLADMGAVILALSFGVSGLPVALALLWARFVALTLAGLGVTVLRGQAGDAADDFASGRGLAWRLPLAVALFGLGLLTLAGLPLTPGFPGRWLVLTLVATDSAWYAALVALAAAGVVVGGLRCLVVFLSRPGAAEAAGVIPAGGWPSRLRQWVLAGALAAGLLLVLFPQALLGLAYRLAALVYG